MNLLRGSYGETGVMDFGLYNTASSQRSIVFVARVPCDLRGCNKQFLLNNAGRLVGESDPL